MQKGFVRVRAISPCVDTERYMRLWFFLFITPQHFPIDLFTELEEN